MGGVHSWVVIQAAAHEIALAALVFALPAVKFGIFFHQFFILETLVGLGGLKIPIPLLQLSIVSLQQSQKPSVDIRIV